MASSGQMWFYHAPAKRLQVKQNAPVASQIPGLAALDELDKEAWEREIGVKTQKKIKDTDSHYIQLAKQGGRKNLLCFPPPKEKTASSKIDEPKPYPRVEWFDHHESDPDKDKQILSQMSWQLPEYMVHSTDTASEEVDSELGKPRKKRAPFYTDNMSVWTRPKEVTYKKNRRKYQLPNNAEEKLPNIDVSAQLKSKSVAFSKLIGGQYGNEWYREQAARDQLKPKERNIQATKGYLNMSEYQENICKKVIAPRKLKPITLSTGKRPTEGKTVEKPIFKLSRFSKVESKVKTGAN